MKSLARRWWIVLGALVVAVGVAACANDDSLNPQPLPPDNGDRTPQDPALGGGGGEDGTGSVASPGPDGKGSDAGENDGGDAGTDGSEGGD